MNYEKIYNSLILKRRDYVLDKSIQYCEKHHIIPISLNGNNNKNNIINLTAREHYIAHLLLVQITKNKYGSNSNEYFKMLKAVTFFKTTFSNKCLINRNKINFNSKIYLFIRINIAKLQSLRLKGKILPQLYTIQARIKISLKNKGRKHTLQTRLKISNSLKGNVIKDETRKKISASLTGIKRPLRTADHKKKISIACKGKCLGPKNGAYNRKWMHHPITLNKVFSKKEDIQYYLSLGYIFGVNLETRNKNKGNFIIKNGKRIFIPLTKK